MQSPYGGYGGGYSPYGMPSQYGPQASYGMPQQQTMMATGAPQTMAATADGGTGDTSSDTVGPAAGAPNNFLNLSGSTKQTSGFEPWGPQQEQLRRYLTGMTGKLDEKGNLEEVSGVGMPTTGAMGELYKQQQAGPLGFDPQSEAALQRMQALSTGANPLVDAATGATRDITSGQANIGTGGMFSNLYQNPGIQNAGQYQGMYDNPNIGGIDQYGRMAGQNAIGNAGQYENMIGQPSIRNEADYTRFGQGTLDAGQFNQLYGNRGGIGTAGYGELAGQDAMNTRRMEDIYGGPGVSGSYYQNVWSDPGVNTSTYQRLYDDPSAVGLGNYSNILGGATGAGSLAGGMFGNVASGNLVNGNPYREKAIQDAMSQTSDEVKATMSSRGRYGSDAYGDAMGRALGQVATQARMAGYDTDTANMMAAAQARSGEGLARQGIGLQAAQGIASAQGQNRANQMQAAAGIASAQGQNQQARLAAAGGIAGIQGANIANQMGAAQSIMNAGGTNAQQRLAALQGLTGAQQAGGQMQLGAAQGAYGAAAQDRANQLAALQGITGLQGQNAQQRLAQIQGLSGIQGQNYNAQLSSLQGMNAAQQMQNQQRMAAAQGLTGVQGQNWQNQLGAANALTGVNSQDLQNRMQAAGMAPAMQGLRYDDIQRQLQAGATREAMAQQQKNYGWDTLGRFQGLVGGVPGSAGTGKSSEQRPWWETGLGLASTIGGFWGTPT
jgi:hypothetical protein